MIESKLTLSDCDSCKRYQESVRRVHWLSCFKADYYMPGMIFYCRPQIRWAISWSVYLAEGLWPPDPRYSGYVDRRIIKGNIRPPSKAASDLHAEISKRLETCGKDGEDLVHQLVNNGENALLTERAEDALRYIIGWRRKKTPYPQWLASRNYYMSIKNAQ